MMQKFAYARPKTIDEALKLLSSPGSMAHAGGTDLLGCLREHVFDADMVVSLSRLEELRGIRKMPDGGLYIGALTTISEIAADPFIRQHYFGLSKAASEVGSPQLRNQGTIGGNLCQKPRCWYYRGEFHCLRKGGETCFAEGGENQFHAIFGGSSCFVVHPSDTAPALAAFEATVHIRGPKGERQVPVGEFHVFPSIDPQKETVLEKDELVAGISLPAPVKGLRSSYRKVRVRRTWDFAVAGLALAIAFEGGKVKSARVVLSGVAPVPWRTKAAEDAITGQKLDTESIKLASEAAIMGARPLEKNSYKVPLVSGLVDQELRAIAV